MKKILTIISAVIAVASFTANAHAAVLSEATSPQILSVSQTGSDSVAFSSAQDESPDYLIYPDWPDDGDE